MEVETAHQESECLATFLGIFSFSFRFSLSSPFCTTSPISEYLEQGTPELLGFFCFSGSPDDHVINRKPIAWENSSFSMLLTAGDLSQGRTSATQWQKFHTDDINQCLHNKSSSHGVLTVNLFNFTFLSWSILVKCCVHLWRSSSKT